MNRVLYIVLFFLFFAGSGGVGYGSEKQKRVATGQVTLYEKFFQGKKKVTTRGLMTLHQMGGKVYAEFPLRLLGKDMLLTSSIEDISDNGEGVVGQFIGEDLMIKFVRRDSVLQARFNVMKKPRNSVGSELLSGALEESFAGGVYKSFAIRCYTPDSSAVVVEMTPLFTEHTVYTNPFSFYAANSMGGMVERRHKFSVQRSFVKGVKGYANNVAVQCQMAYDVDRYVFGVFLMVKDFPVTVTSNRILLLLPDQEMRPRLADARVGTQFTAGPDVVNMNDGIRTSYFARRWRLEPSDEVRFRKGELVEPRKPIVFYLDTVMPDYWKVHVREGVEAWNRAFEKIGFKDAVRVVDFPRNDPSFSATDVNHSTIRYSPTYLYEVQTSMLTDPRTGEILNASVYLHNGLLMSLYMNRVLATMATDARVRNNGLPEEVMGESLRAVVMKAVGTSLGLVSNYAASYVYPVDSLRSPEFTRQYGLSPSVMDDVPCNYVAQPEDVGGGVQLVARGVGEFDDFVVRWLYKPIPEALDFRAERPWLDRWIKGYPEYRYGKAQGYYGRFDPSAVAGDLGNDPVLATRYMISNMKVSIPLFMEWYKGDDRDFSLRSSIYNGMNNLLRNQLFRVMSCFGGIYLHEVAEGDGKSSYEVVPKVKQREALFYLLDVLKDLSWMEDRDMEKQLEITNPVGKDVQDFFFKNLMFRLPYMAICAEKSKDAYTPEEFVDDVYRFVWEGTLKKRPLKPYEMQLQVSLLGSVIATADVIRETDQAERKPALVSVASTREEQFMVPEVWAKAQGCLNDMKCVSAEEVIAQRGFYPVRMVKVKRGSMAPLYYSMLLRIRDLLSSAAGESWGDTKLHYEYLLFKVKQVLEKE